MDFLEIVSLAESEGRVGLERWVGEHAQALRGKNTVESLYDRVMEKSLGAALLLALILRKRELLAPRLAIELRHAQESDLHLWVAV